MTEVVLAGILGGCAYLISNQKKETFEPETNVKKENVLQDNILESSLNMNSNTKLRNNMDKYSIQKMNSSFRHNNMTPFFNNHSYGYDNGSYNNDQRLDTYTGMGTQSIEKQEISSLFKPQDNMQNVFGNQNKNDFIQSRINESNRHANSKPWQEIREAPGDLGFNSSIQYRDETKPKTVDELRTSNNPKSVYYLNYQAPAYQPNQYGHAQLGKTIKKTPDTYHVNNGIGGMGPAYGMEKPTQFSKQMITNENRDTTNVSYYGVKNSMDKQGYVESNYEEPKKNQLSSNPFTNLTSQNVHPTSEQNYGKDGYNLLENNRSNKVENYFGNVKSNIISNVVTPLSNTLKYTKKNNLINNPNPLGNIGGTSKKPIVYNPYETVPTTNREMTTESIGMNHLNVQNQSSDGYISTNPYLNSTQRETTNQSYIGNAMGTKSNKSYENIYNQRNIQKPYENRISDGNMKLFNGNINASINGREQFNVRTNATHIPTNDTHNVNRIGEFTKQNQQFENRDQLDSNILKAFKENPYTHSLSSAV